MSELRFRQLKARPDSWKSAEAERPFSPFTATYSQTQELLDHELGLLGFTDAFLQVELSDPVNGLRNDGMIRASAQVIHPGVILTIETSQHGTLVYPCDKFKGREAHSGWKANLRAVALGLEALRKVERYGIAERGQQYAGYAELGSGMPMGAGGGMTVERAAELLATEANRGFGEEWISGAGLLDDLSCVKGAYRDAVRLHHPDVGGDPEMFRLLTEARDLLTGGAS